MIDNTPQAALPAPDYGLAQRDRSGPEPLELVEAGPNPGSADDGGPARAFSLALLIPYRWSILGIAVLVAALALPTIWLLVVPQYKATAIIEVSPVIPQLLAGKGDMVPLYESYRGSQVDYLTNPVVLTNVLDDPAIRATNWYRGTPASPLLALLDRLHLCRPAPPIDRLAQSLTATAPKGKQLILVALSTPTPGEAKRIVDRVLAEYVKFTNERTSASDSDVMGKLRKEIGDREIELKALEGVAAQLRQQLGTGAPDDLVKQRALDLLHLESTVNTLRTDLEIAKRSLNYARSKAPGPATQPAAADAAATADATGAGATVVAVPAADPRYQLDSRWQQLNDRLTTVQRETERRAERFGQSDQRLAELRRDRDQAEAEVRQWERHLDRLPAPVSVSLNTNNPAALEDSIEQMTIRLDLLTKLLDDEREKSKSVFTEAEKLAQRNAERAATEEMRARLERRLDELRMNREVAGSVRTYAAVEPANPDDDKRLKLSAGALAGALALALATAFLRIKLSSTVDQVVDVARPVHGVLLGRMPLQSRSSATPTLVPEPLLLESVRMIRTALLNRLRDQGRAVIQITSATAGSGKSTLAVLLSRSLAQTGQRVLLVDTDIYRPRLAESFGVLASPGLLELLANPELGAEAIRATPTPGLDVLPAGAALPGDEREPLANGAFSALLARWRRQYNLVLLDGAPLLGVADAAILARRVDGTILVVRQHHCRREAVVDSLARLSAAGGQLLGTVYVGAAELGGYAYGYSYDYAYRRGPSFALDAGDKGPAKN